MERMRRAKKLAVPIFLGFAMASSRQANPAEERPRDEGSAEARVEAGVEEAAPRTAEEEERAYREAIEEERRQIRNMLREDPAWRTTHEEALVIDVGIGSEKIPVHTFCLDREGRLLVGCGGRELEYFQRPGTEDYDVRFLERPAEIRVYGQDGSRLATWKVDVKPEALCALPDGAIFVAGDGKIARLDGTGATLAAGTLPSLEAPKAAAKPRPRRRSFVDSMARALTGRSTEEAPDAEGGGEEEVPAFQRQYQEFSRRAANGIAASDRDVFVVCPAQKGWGFEVFRVDRDLRQPVRVVEALSGCCGQMDIQTKDGELWVAENSRHRVLRYDRNGKLLASFGKRDRKKADCFGGCCEPKNLRFGADGVLYACESGPPVAVKKFSRDGEFLGVAGVPDFYTGCVRVTTEVTPDSRRIFVLNQQAGAIHVLERPEKPSPDGRLRKAVVKEF